jgi:hypothetical protein
MSDAVIIALITAGFPTLTTAITAICQSRAAKKNAAKDSILQMIMEDHLAVLEDGLPTNYQNILHEFDIYSKNGGNSYVHDKIEDYKKWFKHVEGEKHGRNTK